MRSAYPILISAGLLLTAACSTLNESMQLGAGLGTLSGAAATYTAQSTSGIKPSLENVGTGAAVGMAVGLITSYFVHNSVEANRQNNSQQPEMYFGDLPPSPFIFPKQNKKGER